MNKLTESEQRQLDILVNDNDHYRRGIADYRLLQAISESQILRLLKNRTDPLKVAYTSNKRRVCFDRDIVKIEKQPRLLNKSDLPLTDEQFENLKSQWEKH